MLVSAVQWSESTICMHISPPSWVFCPPLPQPHPSRSSQSTRLSSLCSTAASHQHLFTHSSVCMSVCVHACSVVQSYPTLWPMDWGLPGSSVHGIFPARILEWVVISSSSSRGSSWPEIELMSQTWVFCISDGFFSAEPQGKPHILPWGQLNCFLFAL